MMSAHTGQRRKVYPSKYNPCKDAYAATNGDIIKILSKQTVPLRGTSRTTPEGNKRYIKSSRKSSPEVTHTKERGCHPPEDSVNSNHVIQVADDTQNKPKMTVQGRDGKQNFQEMPLEECRQIYKNEINTLWQEVEDFRITCKKEMARQRALLEQHRKNCEEAIKGEKDLYRAPDVHENKDYAKEMKALKENMHTLEEKQKLLDKEQVLVEREEQLSKRHEKLKEYEKDVEEAETLLDKRQHLAKRRSQQVELLNHDLLIMKQDLAESIDSAENQLDSSEASKTDVFCEPSEQTISDASTITNSPQTSCKARRNWQLARRHLVDKVTLLETTIQRYRTQVASSSANITAKDMVITRLQKETAELRDELELKEKRIKQLESRLALSIEDKTRSEKKLDMLLEELQNIDLSATAKASSSPEKTPSKSDTTNKRKLLKKQQSMFSFFNHNGSDKQETSSPALLRRRNKTLGDKESAKKAQGSPLKLEHNHVKHDESGSENRSVHSESDNLSFHDLGNHDTQSMADYQDDLGSKACSLM